MSIYTFYPQRQDGAFNAFDAADLAGDEQACAFAQRGLATHASAVRVVIWLGEREVGRVSRADARLEAAE